MVSHEKYVIVVADDEKEWFDVINSHLNDRYDLRYVDNFKRLCEETLKTKPNLIITDSIYVNKNKEDVGEFINVAIKNHSLIVLFSKMEMTARDLHKTGAIDCIKKPPRPKDIDIVPFAEIVEKYVLKSRCEKLEAENEVLKRISMYDVNSYFIESLKKYMTNYPDTDTKIVSDGTNEYSPNDLIKEIEKNSEVGKDLIKSWLSLMIRITFRRTKSA